LIRGTDDVIDATGHDLARHGGHLLRREFEIYCSQSFTL